MKNKIIAIAFISFITIACKSQKEITSAANLNPVLDKDFPDPTVINVNGKYFAFATNSQYNGKTLNIQLASSTDLQHWKMEGDALPQKPVWASTDFWAPDVIYDKSLNKYVMFYSGKSSDTAVDKCLGVAFADRPEGPFIDKGTPLLCGKSFINIDPKALIDPQTGKKILYWGSAFSPIKVQEMENDWQHFKAGSKATPVVLPGKETAYTNLIEGAWVDYENGYYYLYYSGDNCCGNKANYAVLVARSKNAFGPFETLGESNGTNRSVILEKDNDWLAPGHNSIFRDPKGQAWIAYHAIKRAAVIPSTDNDQYHPRVMCLSKINYKNGWPVVEKKN